MKLEIHKTLMFVLASGAYALVPVAVEDHFVVMYLLKPSVKGS